MDIFSLFEAINGVIDLGGPVVALLAAISVLALALIIIKLWQFAREDVGRHGDAKHAAALFQTGQASEAADLVAGRRGLAEAAVSTVFELQRTGATPRAIEEAVQRLAIERLHELQRGFRALEAIAQTSPLLGLFGTVLGMIEAFRQLQAAGNAIDPSSLAGGIWVALLTTAVGLALAMPVSLVLTFFESRVENERVAVETLTGSVISNHQTENQTSVTETQMEAAGAASA